MFVADAKSTAGALGVMQIMPDTGERIARALGERFTVHLCFFLRKTISDTVHLTSGCG